MKKGYHSRQDKVFTAIPRSEFLGIALGLAFGMILHGILKVESNIPEIAGAAAGFIIGYLIDKLFYQEPDVPEDETE